MALERIIGDLAASAKPGAVNLPNGTRLDWLPTTHQLRATRLEQRVEIKEQRTFEKYIRMAGWEPAQAVFITVPDGMNVRRGVSWTLAKRKAQAKAETPTQEALL